MADTTHQVGAENKIVTVEAIVISTGLPYTAGAFNTATISATYTRDGATPTTITLVTATAGTYTASGFVHRGKGVYEIGAPNAAFVTGADGVEFAVDGIADVLFRTARVELVAGNPRAAAITTADIIAAEIAALDGFTATDTALTINAVAHTITRNDTDGYVSGITAD